MVVNEATESLRRDVQRAFPSQPISDPKLLTSREGTITRCREALEEPGCSLVIFGDYGVGKTSVWQVLLHDKSFERVLVVRNTSIPQVFLQLFDKYRIGVSLVSETQKNTDKFDVGLRPGIVSAMASSQLEEGIQAEPLERPRLNVPILVQELRKLRDKFEYLVIEEAHRLSREQDREDLVDLLKAISDEDVAPKVIVVGIGRSERDLLQCAELDHYQNRMLRGVEVAPLAEAEVAQMLHARGQLISFRPRAKLALSYVSAGYPFVANGVARAACSARIFRGIEDIVASAANRGFLASAKRLLGFTQQLFADGAKLLVEDDDLRSGVSEYAQAANQEGVQWFRDLQREQSDDGVHALRIAHLLSSRDVAIAPEDVAERLGTSVPRVRRVIGKYFGQFAEDVDGMLAITDQHLRWYARAIEYLAPEGVGVDTGKRF